MKSDKEFLEGIYQKAEILKRENNKKKASYRSYIKYSSVAALFIIIPLLFLNSKLWGPNNEAEFPQPRMMTIDNPVSNFFEADYILIGETDEINKSASDSDTTEIRILVDRTFLGEINDNIISLEIQSDMESEFIKGDRSLLFLYKDDQGVYNLTNGYNGQFKETTKDIFIDSNGNEYGIKDIENQITRRRLKWKNQ